MLSYLIPVLNDIFESWRISEIASSFLICKYTVLSCHKTDCHMTTLLDFWIFRIQIQVVNNALRFFSKGHIVYIENPIIFLWIIIPQLCKQRSEILLCFSSLCDQFERFIFCRIVAQSCLWCAITEQRLNFSTETGGKSEITTYWFICVWMWMVK